MKAKILVVDDDVDLLELLSAALKSAGYHVRTEKTGEAALGAAKKFLPDLVLLDLMLPHINGFTVCEDLRSQPATAKAIIIMMTAMAGEFPRMAGLDSGCDAYVQKPFLLDELLSRIDSLLQERMGSFSTSLKHSASFRGDFRKFKARKGASAHP